MALDARVRARLEQARSDLAGEAALLPIEKLEGCYSRFREMFGPDRLRALQGLELLETMHLHANRDSLVYWLEFKDDEELPGIFGSIAGGSALKFGIYRRKETGAWMIGSSAKQVEVSVQDAIGIAAKHRDQLAAASEVLGELPHGASDEAYRELQGRLNEVAPDICDTSWGHKYLSLLHPTKVDDFHSVDFQRFHLIRCLQAAPEGPGRFLAAGRFVNMARELDLPINHLGTILNRANGRPRKVWRVGTRVSAGESENVSIWPMMRNGSLTAIGWSELGDLSWIEKKQEAKEGVRKRMSSIPGYAPTPQVASRKGGEVFDFAIGIEAGDLVLAADGEKILGVGRITGPYRYAPDETADSAHRRPTEWLDVSEWRLPEAAEGLRTTVYPIRKQENLLAVESKLLEPAPGAEPGEPVKGSGVPPTRLTGTPGRLQDILERKGQAILYGPPGTGKTYWARKTAQDLASLSAYGKLYALLSETEKEAIDGDHASAGLVRTCTFHPGYGYEDFLEGYRPTSGASGQLIFERRGGLFKQLCADAATQPGREFYLIIDEINRGDIPRIFGELITLLEWDKRGVSLRLPVSGERFSVPPNVKIIGTMNTADRSIALLDTALRRRFGFVELLPDTTTLRNSVVGGLPLGPWLDAINGKIRDHVGRDARNLQIGHAYLLESGHPIADPLRLARIIGEDIVPLLEEYCYEDYDALAKILGARVVDVKRQRIRIELFLPDRNEELVSALLQNYPDIATTLSAVEALKLAPENGPDESDDSAAASA